MLTYEDRRIDIMLQQHATLLAIGPDDRCTKLDLIDDDGHRRPDWRKFKSLQLRAVDRHVFDRGKFVQPGPIDRAGNVDRFA